MGLGAEGYSAAAATSMDVIAVATAHLQAPTFYHLAWQGITEGASTTAFFVATCIATRDV